MTLSANMGYVRWSSIASLLRMITPTSELHRYLETHPEDATALGFDDVPAWTTFGRTWRVRFDDALKPHY